MKLKAKTKGIIRKVALVLAGVCALGAVGFGVAKLVEFVKDDLKTITPSFDVGNLGTDGKYVSDESTLYTKEAFECDGLQIKLDFDNEISYQIYFYDDLDNFIESTEVLSAAYSETVHDGYARIVIIPTNDEDEKISLTERVTYPGQMTIKVAKEQNVDYYNVFNKRMGAVDKISRLRFSKSIIENVDGNYVIKDDTTGVLSSNLLIVNPGVTVSCNVDTKIFGLGEDTILTTVTLYQFKKSGDSLEFIGIEGNSGGVSSVKVASGVTHIIMRVAFHNQTTSSFVKDFPDGFVDNFNSYITITK